MLQRMILRLSLLHLDKKTTGQKWSETCFGFAEPMRVPMDAITQALPIFADPASSLLPVEETNAAGGSLFGALLAAFVMGDAQQGETPLQPADAPLEEFSAADNAPPPVLTHQWIAQLASMPELPTALDTTEQFSTGEAPLQATDAARNVAVFVPAPQWIAQLASMPELQPDFAAVGQYRSDALTIETEPTSTPAPEETTTENLPAEAAAQLEMPRTPSAVRVSVGSAPAELVFVQSAPPSATAEQSKPSQPPQTHPENTMPSTANVEPKAALPERPSGLSFAPAIMPDSADQTQFAVPVEEFETPPAQAKSEEPSVIRVTQEKPQLPLRASRADEARQGSSETDSGASTVDPSITQFLAPLSVAEVASPAPSIGETADDGATTIGMVTQAPRPAPIRAPLTFDPGPTIPP
jgi:hypothetical protein